MAERDDPGIQRERIRRLAQELIPGCVVQFDPDQPPSWLRFRIDAPVVGTILGVSGHYHSSEIADWSDQRLRDYIRTIAPYFAKG